MDLTTPRRHGPVSLRLVRQRDARVLQQELLSNRTWLRPWEATSPDGPVSFDMRVGIRRLLQQYRDGTRRAVRHGVRRRDRRAAERVGHRPRLALVGDDRLLGERAVRRARASRRPRWPWRPTSASPSCASTAWRSASARRTVASLRVVEKLGFRYEGLRRRFIHINGDWRDHYAFALVREDVPEGVLQRWVQGRVPQDAATIPPADRLHA